MRLLIWCIVFGLIVLVILAIFTQNSTVFNKFMVQHIMKKKGPQESEAGLFAVIINTEECLPARLLTAEYFGNRSSCHCHVYVASYKKRCKENSRFPHVHYYFKKGVRMSAASNIGYFQAKQSNNSYMHYIFMDDDVRLSYNKYTRDEDKARNVSAFRIFTNFLEEYRPARCGPDYQWFNKARSMLHKWHFLCKLFQSPRVFSAHHLDKCFHAVHKDASDFVLPFPEKYDNQSFWLSNVEVSLSFFIYFRGQTIYFPEIKAWNDKHRYSTKEHLPLLRNKAIRREMVEHIRSKTPSKYKKHPYFLEAMNYNIEDREHALCTDPPPVRTPIVPFENVNYRKKI